METRQVEEVKAKERALPMSHMGKGHDVLSLLRVRDDAPIRRSKVYKFVVDTLSSTSLGTVVFGANELLLGGLGLNQMLSARGIGAIIGGITSGPYGMFRDWARRSMHVDDNSGKVKKLLTDIAIAEAFWVPIYAVNVALSGADLHKVLSAVAGGAVIDLFYGRPLGMFMDLARRKTGVRDGGVTNRN